MKRMLYSVRMFWDYIRYDIPRGVKNLWLFRKAVWNYRWYSGEYHVFQLMQTAIADMAKNIETKGIEVDKPRLKKVVQMNRVVDLMEHFINEDFIELAEKELGPISNHPIKFKPSVDHPGAYELIDFESEEEKAHNRKVFKRASEIETQMWAEIWSILKGQDHTHYIMLLDKNKDSKDDVWDEWYDGTGLHHWWD